MTESGPTGRQQGRLNWIVAVAGVVLVVLGGAGVTWSTVSAVLEGRTLAGPAITIIVYLVFAIALLSRFFMSRATRRANGASGDER